MSLMPGVAGQKTELFDGAKIDAISEYTTGNGVQLKGRTSGVAIPSGYIGEVIEFSDSGAPVLVQASPTINTDYAITSGPTITVPAGRWLIMYKLSGQFTTSSAGALSGLRGQLFRDGSRIFAATDHAMFYSGVRSSACVGSVYDDIPTGTTRVYTLRIGISQSSGSTTYSNLYWRDYGDSGITFLRAIRIA